MRPELRAKRGAATVELALLVPVLLLVFAFGEYLGELGVARLKLREAARFAAWEMTARPLDDFGRGATGGAERAAARVARESADRYADLDSIEEQRRFLGLVVGAGGPELRIAVSAAPMTPHFLAPLGAAASVRSALLAARTRDVPGLLRSWGFSRDGLVRVDVSAPVLVERLRGLFHLGARPGGPAGPLEPAARLAMVAGTWALADGADVVVAHGRSGVHRDGERSGLWLQVDRMHLLGERHLLAPDLLAARAAAGALPFAFPDVAGAFAASRNLGPGDRRAPCRGIPGYPPGASGGLQDLSPWLDAGAPRCFGTSPLRDTEEYASSLYAQAFAARGAHFMGCAAPEADDPSRDRDEDLGDRNGLKASCGGQR